MIRRFLLVLCCGVLGVTGVAAAQEPQNELWDEVPLEPTATPQAADDRAAPTPEVVREDPSERIGTGTLVVLVLAAGAVGGLAAHVTARRGPRREPAGKRMAATPHRHPATAKPPAAGATARARALWRPTAAAARPDGGPPPSATEPAADEARPAGGRRAARGRRRAEPTDAAATDTPQADAATPATTGPPDPDPAAPTEDAKPAQPRRAARRPRRAEPTDAPQADAPQADAPAPATTSPPDPESAPPTEEAEPAQARRRRRRAKRADLPQPEAPTPAANGEPEPPAVPLVDVPLRPDPARPAPPPRRAAPPRRIPQPSGQQRFQPRADRGPVSTETCTIRLARRDYRGRFVALGEDGATVARSPIFRLDNPATPDGYSAPQALDDLIGDLAAAGWRQSAKGTRPWDVRLQRRVPAPDRADF